MDPINETSICKEPNNTQNNLVVIHSNSKMEGLITCKFCYGETLKVNKVCHLCHTEVGERCWRCSYLGKVGSKFCFRCNVKLHTLSIPSKDSISSIPLYNSHSFTSSSSNESNGTWSSNKNTTTDTGSIQSVRKILEDIKLKYNNDPSPSKTLKLPSTKKSYRKSLQATSLQSTPATLSSNQLLLNISQIYELKNDDNSSSTSDSNLNSEDEDEDEDSFENNFMHDKSSSTKIQQEEISHDEKEVNSLLSDSQSNLPPQISITTTTVIEILDKDNNISADSIEEDDDIEKPKLKYTQAKYNVFQSPSSSSPTASHCNLPPPPPILLIEDITTTTTTTTTTSKKSIITSPILNQSSTTSTTTTTLKNLSPTSTSSLTSPTTSTFSPTSTSTPSSLFSPGTNSSYGSSLDSNPSILAPKRKSTIDSNNNLTPFINEIIDAFPSPPTLINTTPTHSQSNSQNNSIGSSSSKKKKNQESSITLQTHQEHLISPPINNNIKSPTNLNGNPTTYLTVNNSNNSTNPQSPNSKLNHRNNLINEIITTEKDYISDLETIIEIFYKPLNELISMEESVSIFSNIEEIYKVNLILYEKLKSSFTIGQVFSSLSDSLDVYSVYCNYHQKSLECLSSLMKLPHIESFFVDVNSKIPLGLQSYLIKPIQRICKYPLLLKELLKVTPEDHFDYHQLILATEKIERIVNTINNEKKENETWQRTMQIIQSLKGAENLQLLAANRRLISEGPLQMVEGANQSNNHQSFDESTSKKSSQSSLRYKKGFYFLFNDLFLFSKQKGASYKLLLSIPLETILIHGIVNGNGDKHFFTLVEFGVGGRRWTFYPPSKSQNQSLIHTMQKLIETNWDDKFKLSTNTNAKSNNTNNNNNNNNNQTSNSKKKFSRRLVKSLVNIKST